MAEKTQEFRWVKSPHYRTFSANSAAVQTADLGAGQRVFIRFANLTVDIEKETIPAEQSGEAVIVKGPSTFSISGFYKSEEASIELASTVAGSLIDALLIQAKSWPDNVKAQIRTSIQKFEK